MKHSLVLILVCFAAVFLPGCGDSGDSASAPSPAGGTDAMSVKDTFELYTADTLSADLLAEYNIFTVDDVSASSSGYVALLDGSSSTITVLDTAGTAFITGGSGSGPGEYQQPRSIAISDDGSLAVSDFMGGFVRILEPGLEFYEDISGFIMANPGEMVLLDSGGFVGMRIIFTSDDDQTSIGHQTALWSGTDSEPTLVYNEEMRPFSLNDFGWSLIAPYPMTANPDGVVYTADVATDRYVITSYAPDGSVLWSTDRPFEKTEKSEEEIAIEKETITRLMQQSEHQADYTPEPYHYAVSDLALGPDGNLWAQRPAADATVFDVYDASHGEFLFSASTESDYELLEVTPGGILAVVPGETHSLLLLDLQQGSSTVY
ncbi:MAG: hypothetical protein GF388_08225 [Candidatus Aegiribacteria sp.]|nr:hypothetical protein [Candidatus Aegiribacteria sp.]MBD3295072.1 hypothetical protein [Candidatus Fermentibacteria bacterium]